MKKNTKVALWIGGGVLVLGAIANAGNGDDTSKQDKPAAKTLTTPKAKPSAKAPAPVKFDEPNAAETKALLSKLKTINPGIVVNEERAVRRSVNTCSDIQAGKSGDLLNKNVAYRFTGGNATVDEVQAAEIVKAVKGSFCD
ncbi:hypothetical protein [Streptomyces sp. NPDC047990]|uniref:hypothetical protein n=1 Tax=Streptomyces sp. NPDC047990 TaxID=3365496 RepID=UPI00371064C3